MIWLFSQRWLSIFEVNGITLFPFVFISYSKKDMPLSLKKHESCHVRQVYKNLIIFFYLRYLCEYFFFRLRGFSHMDAYSNISFEKQARQAENLQ